MLHYTDEDDDDGQTFAATRPMKQKVSKIKDGSKRRNYEKYIKKDYELKNLAPICIECGSLASLVAGDVAYPHKPEYRREKAYLCECGGRVRCHPGTSIAQGYPAGYRTAEARWTAHNVFDDLWRTGPFARFLDARSQAYSWLAKSLDLKDDDCHFGMFDLKTCRRATTMCEVIARTGVIH